MYLEISLVFLSAAVFLIAAVTVPLLFQILKVFRQLSRAQELLQTRLPGILQNLEDASINIKRIATKVNDQVEGFSLGVEKVQAVFSLIGELEKVLRIGARVPLFNFMRTVIAAAKGVRVFLSVYATGQR
jgi:hypothetical protein